MGPFVLESPNFPHVSQSALCKVVHLVHVLKIGFQNQFRLEGLFHELFIDMFVVVKAERALVDNVEVLFKDVGNGWGQN